MDSDRALQERRKLREGRGLTVSPSVLSALGTTDAHEGMKLLRIVLGEMGTRERVLALTVDFGLDLPELLDYQPSSREVDFLGDRRSTYATKIGREVKTLARWSDKTIAELRTRLISDQFDGRVIVTAGVQNRRLNGIEVMQYDREDTTLSHGRTTG